MVFVNPKARNSPKILQSMVFEPKIALEYGSYRALGEGVLECLPCQAETLLPLIGNLKKLESDQQDETCGWGDGV